MYKFEYNITEQEYADFNEYYFLNSKTGKRALLLFRCFGFIFSIMALVIFIIANAEILLIIIEAIVLTIFSIIWFITGKRVFFKKLRKTMNKMKEKEGLPYSEEGTLVLDENEITDISTNQEIKTGYSAITQLVDINNAIYIICSNSMAYIIPFRVTGTNSINEIKVFLEDKTGLRFN